MRARSTRRRNTLLGVKASSLETMIADTLRVHL
ncbi:hypothetical protein X740_19700 [Mesorhizobium sp. LNHC221B00]|nr:hypothetical protein X740_19700 [Mesorhizobium sp. LNHC221B00]